LKALGSKAKKGKTVDLKVIKKIEKALDREPELLKQFPALFDIKKPSIDRIAVTSGPGLEPALWVGINFTKALSILWDVEVVPVNHMGGHFLAPLAENKKIEFPALGLLISGGHTELVLAKSPVSYKLLGRTRDDAAGEAYDKTARILGLPYPGGPLIANLAEKARKENLPVDPSFALPRPMIHTKEIEFSFSGLKTAVLYMAKKFPVIDEKAKESIAREFEEAVKDVLVSKTARALKEQKPKTLLIGGGVSANTYIKKHLEKLAKENGVAFLASSKTLATDNAIMIGVAGYFAKPKVLGSIKAEGNLELTK
jgi:N6-L-threonylcarbamoyladenine synthase